MDGEDRVARLNVPTVPATPKKPSDRDAVTLPTVAEPSSRSSQERSVFDPPQQRFEERGELGRGGMGRVVEAIDRALDRTVAIKHSLATDDRNLARFEREVRITARLQHPGIVPILDLGRDDDGHPFYVMRKIDGEPLSKRVEQAATIRDRVALVPAVLGAVDAAAYAHAQNVVHRDIKPWNILLGPFGETLLIDWGLARELGEGVPDSAHDESPGEPSDALTRMGKAYGTPGYMAPEQARGEPADRRADVYSLGATLYFVLAGVSPFGGSSATTAIASVAAGKTPELGKIPEEVPVELVAIVEKALATDLEGRYADASELAADLRRFLAGQLVAAHDYTAAERVARWIKRHRLVAAIAVAAIAAIAVVSIVSVRRVIAERDEADAARRLAEARAEEMLLDRARAMTSIDPTSAIALLRGLPAASPRWPTAREIARVAVASGVERGFTPHTKTITVATFGPDDQLATSSYDNTVRLHNLATHASRTVAALQVDDLGWLDDRTLVYTRQGTESSTLDASGNMVETSTPPELGLIDIASGEHHVLPVGRYLGLRLAKDRIVIHASNGSVNAYHRDGSHDVIAASGIEAIDLRAGHLVLLAKDRVTVIDDDGTRRDRAVELAGLTFGVRVAPSGQRVAAVIEDALVEWSMTDTAPPRRWARSTAGLDSRPHKLGDRTVTNYDVNAGVIHNVQYIGDTLYAWSLEGARLLSFESEEPKTRWTTVGQPLSIAPAGDGALLATREGRVAVAGPFGVVELPHRAVDTTFLLVDPNMRRGVRCTSSNELLVLDLAPIRPRILAQPPKTVLFAARDHRVVIGHDLKNGEPQLAVVDAATGARTELGRVGIGPSPTLLQDRIVATAQAKGARSTSWDRAGHEQSSDTTDLATTGPGLASGTSMFFVRVSGDVVERPIEPLGEPRTIGHLAPLSPEFTHGGINITADEHGVVIISQTRQHKRLTWIGSSGQHDLEPDLPDMLSSAIRLTDGTWWIVSNFQNLSRLPPGGKPIAIDLHQQIRSLRLVDDEIWAIGESAVLRLDREGQLLGTASVPGRSNRTPIDRGFALTTPRGVEVMMPIANTRRSLMLPAAPVYAAASDDGRTVAVIAMLGDQYTLALWTDPVPLDPAAVRAYLGTITNARLALGSDGLLWDSP